MKGLSRTLLPLSVLVIVAGGLAAVLGLTLTGEVNGPLASTFGTITNDLIVAVKCAEYLALALAFGYALTLSLFQPGSGRTRGHKSPRLSGVQDRQRRLAVLFTLGYALLLALGTYLTYANARGSMSPQQLGYFIWRTDLGRATVWALVFALLSAGIGALTRHLRGAGWLTALLALSVIALGFLGHAGNSTDHLNAVNAMIAHLLGVLTWLGPLLVFLAEAHRTDTATLATWLKRYSPWALFAILALVYSGIINAAIRLENPAQFVTTRYGWLVLLKALLTVAIAAIGYAQRRRALTPLVNTYTSVARGDRMKGTVGPAHAHVERAARRAFARLARVEVLIAAVILGASSALGRSEPPVPQYVPPETYRVLSLVGYEPPSGEFSLLSLVTVWQMDWMFTGVAALFAVLYLLGLARLRARGDHWPHSRTIFWLAGCLALFWVMSGGAAAFGRVRFDAHMTQHMALMVIVPPLLVLGAPVTMLSRAATPRSDGSRGMREWILAILHTRYATVVSSPPIAGFLFAGSLVLFYFTPFFTWAMFEHVGHLLMTVHFLLAGYLFAWVIIGIDPAQKPISPVLKLVTLLVTLTFHAFFGIAVVSATWLIGGDWYTLLNMFPRAELERQQFAGGSIMWGISEVPTAFYALIAGIQWSRSEERAARNYDRKAERDGGAELENYNAYLRALQDGEGTHVGDESDSAQRR
ncbi:cytochrome c oxidase assembly protein [Dermabacter hominis]|uniref:cytochrome c oxidase assembly protein n=1 Tax=Dermabacter hominis TaxID=36740 RepID=UPI0021A53CCC|nr:cytochrome c oxidase assembly protein [Dermabacter hominis]MCT2056879.1 cytochrome c oxidase assembly protein [Dermabacter hominis]MCT2083923.1 cytochrome c oxidase assembly protein [Dermabacter hominis]MCT2091676.1 cytochrome c oxidase assembly protein [Dermabacter hominis]MCT2191261.1 cytochrome c oxidase assembly protein [Dermabacter hominis]MCT2227371.1 cytochrome c oxidase assembly protein [Dermabacter hominis]